MASTVIFIPLELYNLLFLHDLGLVEDACPHEVIIKEIPNQLDLQDGGFSQ
jgi:hypothetical protein